MMTTYIWLIWYPAKKTHGKADLSWTMLLCHVCWSHGSIAELDLKLFVVTFPKYGKIETCGEAKKNMDTYRKKHMGNPMEKHWKLMKHVRQLRCLTFNYDDNCGLGRYRRTAVDVDVKSPLAEPEESPILYWSSSFHSLFFFGWSTNPMVVLDVWTPFNPYSFVGWSMKTTDSCGLTRLTH